MAIRSADLQFMEKEIEPSCMYKIFHAPLERIPIAVGFGPLIQMAFRLFRRNGSYDIKVCEKGQGSESGGSQLRLGQAKNLNRRDLLMLTPQRFRTVRFNAAFICQE